MQDILWKNISGSILMTDASDFHVLGAETVIGDCAYRITLAPPAETWKGIIAKTRYRNGAEYQVV